jgi:hypothetical protein
MYLATQVKETPFTDITDPNKIVSWACSTSKINVEKDKNL